MRIPQLMSSATGSKVARLNSLAAHIAPMSVGVYR